MRHSTAWIQQAESDLKAGKKVDNPQDPPTFCQAISKYHQALEKAVKAVASVLQHGSVFPGGPGKKHPVAPLLSAILKIPRSDDNRDLMRKLDRVFSPSLRQELKELDALAPVYPAPSTPHARNHEYPFQNSIDDWQPPCAEDAFASGEMKRFRATAENIYSALRKTVDGLERVYPQRAIL
ncbi:MAG TPA: HEPN domain-containing protein [Tepidisphaeraceae bacterium]|nr:HEPN domain-containing protein [Tepidisphaeraceae bacterium]